MATAAQSDWVTRVLGISVSGTAPADAPDLFGELRERLMIVAEDAKFHRAMESLAVPLRLATEAVKSHNPTAEDHVGRLEDALAAFVRARRQESVVETVRSVAASAEIGVVAFGKLRLALGAAQTGYTMAVSNLEAATEALLATPAFLADARTETPQALAAAAGVGDRVPDIGDLVEDVEDALDQLANTADPVARAAAAKAVREAIAAYRTELDADPILKFMEATPAGAFAIHSALSGALDQLSEALAE